MKISNIEIVPLAVLLRRPGGQRARPEVDRAAVVLLLERGRALRLPCACRHQELRALCSWMCLRRPPWR